MRGDPKRVWAGGRMLSSLGPWLGASILVLIGAWILAALTCVALARRSGSIAWGGDLSPLHALAAWEVMLGAPVQFFARYTDGSLGVEAHGALRLPATALLLWASLPFVLGGWRLTRDVREADAWVHLIRGASAALPVAALGAGLAGWLPPARAHLSLAPGGALDVTGTVSSLHAAGAIMACGMVMGALGGTLRAWRHPGRTGATGIALITLVSFATLAAAWGAGAGISAWRTPALRQATEPLAEGLRASVLATVGVGFLQAPLLAGFVPLDAELVMGTVGASDGQPLRLRLDVTGVQGDLPAKVPLPRSWAWGMLLPLAAAGMAGRLLVRRHGMRDVGRFVLVGALLWVAAGAYGSAWLDAQVALQGLAPAPPMRIWGWWHPAWQALALSSLAQAALGGALGAAFMRLRRRRGAGPDEPPAE